MAGYEKAQAEFAAEGISMFAASAQGLEHAREVQDEVSYPVAYGVTEAIANTVGGWWETRRGIVQPSEFLLERGGKVLFSSYSSGPIGRVDAADVVKLVRFLKSQAAKT